MGAPRARAAFTLIELMLVMVVLAIGTALAMPQASRWMSSERLKGAVRGASDAMQLARSQAIATGNNHMVFFQTGLGTDPCGNPIQDITGNPMPIVVLNDSAPGSPLRNCCIDPGEALTPVGATVSVFWGTTFALGGVPTDTGGGIAGTGTTFTDQNGNPTNWVLFRPDGVPVGVTAACVEGGVGTGGGGVYLSNAIRDYSAVLSPLGGVKSYAFDRTINLWN